MAMRGYNVRFPHACGGVPVRSRWEGQRHHVFPTHVGVYRYFEVVIHAYQVFPTHVGVYRPLPAHSR